MHCISLLCLWTGMAYHHYCSFPFQWQIQQNRNSLTMCILVQITLAGLCDHQWQYNYGLFAHLPATEPLWWIGYAQTVVEWGTASINHYLALLESSGPSICRFVHGHCLPTEIIWLSVAPQMFSACVCCSCWLYYTAECKRPCESVSLSDTEIGRHIDTWVRGTISVSLALSPTHTHNIIRPSVELSAKNRLVKPLLTLHL